MYKYSSQTLSSYTTEPFIFHLLLLLCLTEGRLSIKRGGGAGGGEGAGGAERGAAAATKEEERL